MKLYDAKVADVLRLSQRDDVFLRDVEDQIHSIVKLMGHRNYYKINKTIPLIANVWYYFITTLGNLQTLGEEYTGTIRIDSDRRIPTKFLQTLWLLLYIGGEPMVDRFLNSSRNKITRSSSLTNYAKDILLKCVDFLTEEKSTLQRIHTSLFYTDGRYYNISNRLSGIQYVLLRPWLQDDTFSGSFRFLGNISLFYVIYRFVSKLFSPSNSAAYSDTITQTSVSTKGCVLCGDNIKSASATPCGHIFCWKCIYDSLKYQKACPICRETINPSRIICLQNYL